MSFRRGQAPGDLDTDGVRKFTEDQLLKIQRATAEMTENHEALAAQVAANTTNITTNTADITKIRHNQNARVYLASQQTGVADATYTQVNFNGISFDPSSIWDNTNKWFLPTIAGLYRVSWCLYLRNNAAGIQLTQWTSTNGASGSGSFSNAGAASIEAISIGTDIALFNGSSDAAYLRGYITNGSARLFEAGSGVSYFSIELLRAT